MIPLRNMNRVMTYSICAESNAPMLPWRVENPLVAMVVRPWLTASNHPIPHTRSDMEHATVSNIYMLNIQRDPTDTRECILRWLTPVDSAAKSCTLSIPNMGNMATVKNTIPRPPSHCVRLRQRSNA